MRGNFNKAVVRTDTGVPISILCDETSSSLELSVENESDVFMKMFLRLHRFTRALEHNRRETQLTLLSSFGKICIYICLIYITGLIPVHTEAIRWLGIYRLPRGADHPVDSKADRFTRAECYTASMELGLRRRQSWFCTHPRFGYSMLAVLRAAHAVGYHCPKVFSDRRWNCTSIHRLPEVSPELRKGTREQAVVHAFSSAALLFEIGRYCALNKIRYCSCDEESASQTVNNFPPTSNEDESLFYQSGMEMEGMNPPRSVPSNGNPMTEGQSTVSRYYWTGCSDNIRVAREYVAAFLGIPKDRIMKLSTTEIEELAALHEIEEIRNERFTRSATIGPDEEEPDDENRIAELEQEIDYHPTRSKRDLHDPWMYTGQNTGIHPSILPMAYPRGRRKQSMPQMNTRNMQMYQSDRRWRRQPNNDERRARSQIRRTLNRHNYLAGIVLMEANQKSVCKCHGISGSCAHRVCFRQLRRIDNEIMQKALKLRYLAAKHVTIGKKKQLIAKTFTGAGFVDEIVKLSELVFSEHSPDYCNYEPHRGSVGTHGRKCTLVNSGTAHCLNMCCGRGYINVTSHELVQCNCRMGDGFKVQCDQCSKEIITQQCL